MGVSGSLEIFRQYRTEAWGILRPLLANSRFLALSMTDISVSNRIHAFWFSVSSIDSLIRILRVTIL
jgi:hypothetical protein